MASAALLRAQCPLEQHAAAQTTTDNESIAAARLRLSRAVGRAMVRIDQNQRRADAAATAQPAPLPGRQPAPH